MSVSFEMEPVEPGPMGALDHPDASAMLDAVADIDRMIASLSAAKARLVSMAFDSVLADELSVPTSRTQGAIAEFARQTVVAEIAPLLRITGHAAARLVGESRVLARRLPETLLGLVRGDFSYRHAQTVIDAAMLLPDEAIPAFEAQVLPEAVKLNTSRFSDRVRRIRERVHPESIETRRARQFDRRSVSVEPAADAMAWLSVYGPAEQLVALDDRLDRLAAALRSPDDPRTFAQLRYDAFCDLALTGEVPGVVPTGIRPQVLVSVPALTLLGLEDEPASLEGYGPIPASVARLLAAEAPSFVRLLTHPETGAVLSVGRDRYAVPADMRLLLRVRDEFCTGIGCGRRAANCDIDHGVAWADGGTTSVDNLAHLCRGDHTRKHTLRWRMDHLPGGTIRWTSPMGRSYLTEPSAVVRT